MRRFLVFMLASMAIASSSLARTPEPWVNPDPMAAMDEMEPMDHWMSMLHGYAFLNFNDQGGPSGGREFESQNHLMAMAMHAWLGGKLSLLGTFTLEPATIPAHGSHELFQRGETYGGVLLIDRQHPHDFFVELAAAWEKALGPDLRMRLYVAPVGQPALGPPAYPHRLSASENPNSPLSHHNQDATHITYDVLTLGLSTSLFTLEGSGFHGAEPDENRWNIQAGKIDSYSGRLTAQPFPGLSVQVSAGHLERPEAIEPGDQTRATASAIYQRTTPGGFVAVTLATGRNLTSEGVEWGTLLEWTWKFAEANFLYGRLEAVDRDVYELTYKRQRPEDVPPQRTRVRSGTLGYVRNFPLIAAVSTGLGGDVTWYGFARSLDSVYGRNPVSFHIFGRIGFEWPSMGSHAHH